MPIGYTRTVQNGKIAGQAALSTLVVGCVDRRDAHGRPVVHLHRAQHTAHDGPGGAEKSRTTDP